jgi:hypothetical protein
MGAFVRFSITEIKADPPHIGVVTTSWENELFRIEGWNMFLPLQGTPIRTRSHRDHQKEL